MSKIRFKVDPVSAESSKTFFEIVGVVLLGLTFIDGGLIWYFSRQVNKEQAELVRTQTELAKQFDERLTTAKTELNKQEARAADAERNLEAERIARLELAERLADRKINSKHIPSIVAKLSKFGGYQANLSAVPEVAEGFALANTLQDVLRQAKWISSFSQVAGLTLGLAIKGVAVKPTSDPRSIEAANAILEILKAEKIEAFVLAPSSLPANANHDDRTTFAVFIIVGSKP